MIDGKIRNNLLQEFEKSGNVYLSCLKVGVNKATYYRWRQTDKSFREHANRSLRSGRENMCDIAEHALMMNVKDKKMDAIKYVLAHNSPKYRARDRKVIIEHSNRETGGKTVAERIKVIERQCYDESAKKLNEIIEIVRIATDPKEEDVGQ